MDNMETIIKKHNRKVTSNARAKPQDECNCRKKDNCPLENKCLSTSLVYNANVTTTEDTTGKNYIGLTEGTFKQRYTQHALSFQHRKYANSTEFSKSGTSKTQKRLQNHMFNPRISNHLQQQIQKVQPLPN